MSGRTVTFLLLAGVVGLISVQLKPDASSTFTAQLAAPACSPGSCYPGLPGPMECFSPIFNKMYACGAVGNPQTNNWTCGCCVGAGMDTSGGFNHTCCQGTMLDTGTSFCWPALYCGDGIVQTAATKAAYYDPPDTDWGDRQLTDFFEEECDKGPAMGTLGQNCKSGCQLCPPGQVIINVNQQTCGTPPGSSSSSVGGVGVGGSCTNVSQCGLTGNGGCMACNNGTCMANPAGAGCSPAVPDMCHAYVCDVGGNCNVGAPVSCDDGNPCTVDTCNAATGCLHTIPPGSCNTLGSNGCSATGGSCSCTGGTTLQPSGACACPSGQVWNAGTASCVQCMSNSDCPAGSNACLPNVCNQTTHTCVASTTTPFPAPAGCCNTPSDCGTSGCYTCNTAHQCGFQSSGTACFNATPVNFCFNHACDGTGGCTVNTTPTCVTGNVCETATCTNPATGVCAFGLKAGATCKGGPGCNFSTCSCTGGAIANSNGFCFCPEGMIDNNTSCSCPPGTDWNGNNCVGGSSSSSAIACTTSATCPRACGDCAPGAGGTCSHTCAGGCSNGFCVGASFTYTEACPSSACAVSSSSSASSCYPPLSNPCPSAGINAAACAAIPGCHMAPSEGISLCVANNICITPSSSSSSSTSRSSSSSVCLGAGCNPASSSTPPPGSSTSTCTGPFCSSNSRSSSSTTILTCNTASECGTIPCGQVTCENHACVYRFASCSFSSSSSSSLCPGPLCSSSSSSNSNSSALSECFGAGCSSSSRTSSTSRNSSSSSFIIALNTCGNGIVESPELCDDGNQNDFDGCTNFCTFQLECLENDDCPDGEICINGSCFPEECTENEDCPLGEICEEGVCTPEECTEDDDCPPGAICENNICVPECIENNDCPNGEICVNQTCTGGCVTNNDCPAEEVCINGTCTGGCINNSDCPVGICINGSCNPCSSNSQCLGNGVCINGTCTNSSSSFSNNSFCGNGVLNSGEQCDDGNTVPNDGCSVSCRFDGPGCFEDNECASGRCINGSCFPCTTDDECAFGRCINNVCQSPTIVAAAPVCGNGVLETPEECDDANTRDQDGCTVTCLLEVGICGDGVLQKLMGEQCEQSLHSASLPYTCIKCRYASKLCGNDRIDPGEECDLGKENSELPDAECRTDCSRSRCGDGIIDTSELCDDGNRIDGDSCDRLCQSTLKTQVATNQTIQFPQFPTHPNSTSVLPFQLPLANLQPLIQSQGPVGDTGPAAVAVIGAGAASGIAWVRRKRRK